MTKSHATGTEHVPDKKPAAKKLHLSEIRSVQAKDGSIVHHHTYKDHADAQYPHPERGPMATSSNAEEAGQHVAEQFGQNGMNEEAPEGAGAGAGAQADPAGEAAGAPPQE